MSTELSKEFADFLKPLFEEAEKKDLWFYAPYLGLWFSPPELREAQKNCRFRWGAENWRLGDPKEHLKYLRRRAAEETKRADDFEERIGTTGEEVPV